MKCEICDKQCEIYCFKCNKGYYCSVKHANLHKKIHQNICYPAQRMDRDEGARPDEPDEYFTTKDIRAGEVIFRERPFFIGPGYPLFYYSTSLPTTCLCLGCYRGLNRKTSYKCGKCNLPMCDVDCENVYWHKDFECALLRKLRRGIFDLVTGPIVYYYITIVRFLLLKVQDPDNWTKLSLNFSQVRHDLDADKLKKSKALGFKVKKLFKGFKSDLPFDNIVDAVAVLTRFGMHTISSRDLFCTALYSKARKFPHKCTPNTASYHRFENAKTMIMENIAFVDIPVGTILTQSKELNYITMGSERRRMKLQTEYNWSCLCARCADPTELGTYFSARKCVAPKCVGYMLPTDPLNAAARTDWECDTCHAPIIFDDEMVTLHEETELLKAARNQRSSVPVTPVQMVLQLEQTLRAYEDVVHTNHYSVFEGEELLLDELLSTLKMFPPALKVQCAARMIEICQKGLRILNKIMPGFCPRRGRLLFFLAQGIGYYVERYMTDQNLGPVDHNVIYVLHKAQRSSLEMLRIFPDNYGATFTPAAKMIKILEESMKEEDLASSSDDDDELFNSFFGTIAS